MVIKDWKKLFKIVALIIIIFSLGYTFILLVVRAAIVSNIQKATGLKTTISRLNILPGGIEVRGFEISGLIKAGRIYVSPSIPRLLTGKLAFNKILIGNPEFAYQRNPVAQPPKVAQGPATEGPAQPAVTSKISFPVIIKKLKVYSGKLHFVDTTAASGKIAVLIKDINFYITNLGVSGKKDISNFELRGNLSWDTGEPDGKLSLAGWVDLNKQDMQAALKIENIDAIVFYPYYSTWVDLEKARIKQAKLNFNCDIQGVSNNVTAECHLELADMVRSVRLVEEPPQKAERLTDAVLDMFKSMDNGKVVLDFILHTKMTQPEFGFANVKAAFEGKLMQARTSAGLRPQDMLSWPGRWVRNGIKTGADLSNAVIDGLIDLGNGVKHFFEERMNRPAPDPVQGQES